MPSAALSPASDPTPEERRRQVAAILVHGVVRHRRSAERAEAEKFSRFRNTGLEVVSETRLSVSKGRASETSAPDCEVNDGRNA